MPDLSPGYAAADIAFVTPTWRGDLERFQLLRESMAAMGLGAVPHYAVVQTEDLALFRQGAAGPIYLSTAEVLPAEVEQRRRRYLDRTPNRRLQVLKRSAYKRFGWFADANYYGWHTQQLVKFAVARQFPQRVLITLDSDVIFTQPVPASAYAADGRVVLYEEPDVITRPLASPGWYGHACTLFGLPWPRLPGAPFVNYVTHPFVFDRGTLRDMLDAIEARHQRHWWQALLAQPLGQWSEFMTYGVYVSQLRQYAGVWTERASLACRWLHTAEERAHPEAAINAAFDDPAVRYLTIQADHHAHFRVADYAPWVRSALALRAA
tara:strand:- start:1998 stop:2963 length:966 start_codon:yes stop_codon:yes gene_type:complete